MSRFTKFRDKITGAVGSVVQTGLGVAGSVLGAAGLGGVLGQMGLGQGMQGMGQMQMFGGQSGVEGYQQNLEGLANMVGQMPSQAPIAPTNNQSGGLI